jgi:POT family proton-dependent oligopeptide transporter
MACAGNQEGTEVFRKLFVSAEPDRSFFGHPKGLGFLLGAEFGWAFAYYGFQVVLTLYMTGQLLKPGHAEHVWGFSAYEALLTRLFGPLTPLEIASQTFGIATSLVYVLPIFGGLLADRWFGQRRTALTGLLVLVGAHVLMIREETFLLALALLCVGTGLLKTNLVGQIGRLYAPDDDRRVRGFGLYLIALNTGSLATPLISGTLGERLGWSYGFIAMAVGMGFGAISYLAGIRHTPQDLPSARNQLGQGLRLEPRTAWLLAAILVLILLDGVWQGVYNQAFNVFPVWAEAHVDRRILGFDMPVTWFSTVDGIMTIAGTAVAVRIWTFRKGRASETTDLRRILLGLGLAAAAYLVLTLATALSEPGKVPIAPEILFFVLIDFSIPWVDTTVMTMISRDAPVRLCGVMLGLYYLATAFGNLLTGLLGTAADRMAMPAFWLMHAGVYGLLMLTLLLGGKWLARRLAASH